MPPDEPIESRSDDQQISVLNLIPSAVDSLLKKAGALKPHWPGSCALLKDMCSMLVEADKYLLPDRGQFLRDRRDAYLPEDSLKLPSPLVAVEYLWPHKGGALPPIGGHQQFPAVRRIALCVESDPHRKLTRVGSFSYAYPGPGKLICSFFDDGTGDWQWIMGGIFVPYSGMYAPVDTIPHHSAAGIAKDAFEAAGLSSGDGKGRVGVPLPLFTEFVSNYDRLHGKNKALASVILDTRDEVASVDEFCAVLACANVVTASTTAPSAQMNSFRGQRGKTRLFAYKVPQMRSSSEDAGSPLTPTTHIPLGRICREGSPDAVGPTWQPS